MSWPTLAHTAHTPSCLIMFMISIVHRGKYMKLPQERWLIRHYRATMQPYSLMGKLELERPSPCKFFEEV